MKIAVNASFLSPKPSGIGIYTLEILKIWAQMPEFSTHQIDVFSPVKIPNWDKNFRWIPLKPQMGRSTSTHFPAIYRHWWNAFIFPKIAKNYDRVYSPSPNSGKIPQQIITVHDFIALSFPRQHLLQYFFTKFRLPSLLKSSVKIICISQQTQKLLHKHFKIPLSQTKIISNGVSLQDFSPSKDVLDLPSQYILCVGLSLPHKNLEVVLKAMPSLKMDLIITGQTQGKYKQKLQNLIAKLQLQQRVHWWEYTSTETLVQLYQNAFALVYPSLAEGFGMPMLEAQSHSCPVVVAPTPALLEVGGAGVLVADSHNPQSWVANLKKLENNEKRQEMIDLGAENSQNFSWQKCAQQIAELVLNSSSANSNV